MPFVPTDHKLFLLTLRSSVAVFLCRSEDANKSFSAAVQLHDSLVKAWALWGDYLDQLFAKDRSAGV